MLALDDLRPQATRPGPPRRGRASDGTRRRRPSPRPPGRRSASGRGSSTRSAPPARTTARISRHLPPCAGSSDSPRSAPLRQLRPGPQRPARHRDRATGRSAAGRRGDRLTWRRVRSSRRSPDMAAGSYYLYVVAGSSWSARSPPTLRPHRPLPPRPTAWRRHSPRGTLPAFAGAVGGSFVGGAGGRGSRVASRAPSARSPSALPGRRSGCSAKALLLRGIAVCRGPWGTLVRVQRRAHDRDRRRLPLRPAALPCPFAGIPPLGVALALFLYSWTLPNEIETLVPAFPEPAAPDDPRRFPR